MMDLTQILDDGLRRLASGQSRAEVLALYPEQAHRLAPMLDAAARFAALSDARLSDPQKLRAKVALRAAIAERSAPRARLAWPRLRALPVALLLAALLVTALSVSAVASSRPGDMAYPLRVVIERAPILVQLTPAGRAAAELDVSDRRMADVDAYFSSTGQAYPLALDALLEGDEEAASHAARLSGEQRAGVAARIAAHADTLEALADAASDPADTLRLRAAAERSRQVTKGLAQNSPVPAIATAEPPPDSDNSRTVPSERTATPTPTAPSVIIPPTPAAEAANTSTPVPTAAPLPTRTLRPRLRPTVILPPSVATRLADRASRATSTSAPGSTVTAGAPTATRERPKGIWTRVATLLPPTRTPLPAWTPRPPLPDWTPRPTRTPLPAWTARPMRTPQPAWTPRPARTPEPLPTATAVPPAETAPAPTAASPEATPTPLPEPGATPGSESQAPGPRSANTRRP